MIYILTPHNASVGALRWKAEIHAADDQHALRSAEMYLKDERTHTAYSLWRDDESHVATLTRKVVIEVRRPNDL